MSSDRGVNIVIRKGQRFDIVSPQLKETRIRSVGHILEGFYDRVIWIGQPIETKEL
jgi:hypothetical protein